VSGGCDAGGDVEESVADGLGCGASELSGAANRLGPGEQAVGTEAELHPDVVVDDVVEGRVREPGRFGVADDVLGACASTLAELERGDVVAGGVGDERGVPESFHGVENDNWAPRVRTLAAHDQPGPRRPGVEVHQVGELGDFGAVAVLAVGIDSWEPTAGRHTDDAITDAFVDAVAEAELDVAVHAFLREPVRSPSRIGTNQDLALHQVRVVTDLVTGPPRRRELCDRVSEQHDVIDGGVRAGVAGTQDPGEDFVGLGAHRQQRVLPERALVGRRGVLLVGLGADDRG